MADSLRVLPFTAGLEAVIRETVDEGQLLPDGTGFKPVGEQIPDHLDALLRVATMDQALREFVRPRVDDLEVLTPGRYEHLLRAARDALAALSRDGGGSDALLTRAVELLEQEEALRALLLRYRNTLVQA